MPVELHDARAHEDATALPVDVAHAAQRADLGPAHARRGRNEDDSRFLGTLRPLPLGDERNPCSGWGTRGGSFGIDGGDAHCAGLESRQPHRQACVNIEETQAWIWYTVVGLSPRSWWLP
jgi:hypothetical protein